MSRRASNKQYAWNQGMTGHVEAAKRRRRPKMPNMVINAREYATRREADFLAGKHVKNWASGPGRSGEDFLGVEEPAFDRVVRKLGLRENELATSVELRAWAKKNCQRHYVPEYLLVAWRLQVRDSLMISHQSWQRKEQRVLEK